MSTQPYTQQDLLTLHDTIEDLMESTRALAAISDGEERLKLEKLARQLSGLCNRTLEKAFKLSSLQLGEAMRKLVDAQDLIAQAERDVERVSESIDAIASAVETMVSWLPAP
jgi:hypothetical protein